MIDLLKNSALASFFGLMITLICWITLAEHGEHYPTSGWLIIALTPLLFPLRGILYGKPYTYAWAGFLILIYFAHGIGELYSADGFHLYASLEVLFSFIFFVTSITFIRMNARAKEN